MFHLVSSIFEGHDIVLADDIDLFELIWKIILPSLLVAATAYVQKGTTDFTAPFNRKVMTKMV